MIAGFEEQTVTTGKDGDHEIVLLERVTSNNRTYAPGRVLNGYARNYKNLHRHWRDGNADGLERHGH